MKHVFLPGTEDAWHFPDQRRRMPLLVCAERVEAGVRTNSRARSQQRADAKAGHPDAGDR